MCDSCAYEVSSSPTSAPPPYTIDISSAWLGKLGARAYHVDNVCEESIRLPFTIVIHRIHSRVTQRLRRRKRALVARRKSSPALAIEDDIHIRSQFRCECCGEICIQIPTIEKLALRIADKQHMPHRHLPPCQDNTNTNTNTQRRQGRSRLLWRLRNLSRGRWRQRGLLIDGTHSVQGEGERERERERERETWRERIWRNTQALCSYLLDALLWFRN